MKQAQVQIQRRPRRQSQPIDPPQVDAKTARKIRQHFNDEGDR